MKRLLIPIFSCLLFSCKSPQQITYFQGLEQQIGVESVIDTSAMQIKIQPQDVLTITVNSIVPNSVSVFNLPVVTYPRVGTEKLGTGQNLQTYAVNEKGNIDFPVLGELHVAGMTRTELTQFLKDKIKAYVKDPIITVQIINFRFAVLGSVNSPGIKSFENDRLSILEAIGLAGDLNVYGNRSNVLVIREEGNKRTYHRVDLTRPDLFASDIYYLKQNDVIYVEPNKASQGNAKYNNDKGYKLSLASTIIGAVTTISSFLIVFLNR